MVIGCLSRSLLETQLLTWAAMRPPYQMAQCSETRNQLPQMTLINAFGQRQTVALTGRFPSCSSNACATTLTPIAYSTTIHDFEPIKCMARTLQFAAGRKEKLRTPCLHQAEQTLTWTNVPHLEIRHCDITSTPADHAAGGKRIKADHMRSRNQDLAFLQVPHMDFVTMSGKKDHNISPPSFLFSFRTATANHDSSALGNQKLVISCILSCRRLSCQSPSDTFP